MYKKSYYLISTPIQPEVEGTRHILFSTRTSEALLIDSETHVKIEEGRFDEIPEESIQLLVNKKVLVPEDEHELKQILDENHDAINSETLLYEVIQPSAMCQLGCDYCGQEHKKHNATSEISNLIVERIEKKLRGNPNFKGVKIGWFGGEPLMALNEIRKLTKRLRGLCDERGLDYSAKVVTNGLSLKENIFVELARELGITSLEITLDGTDEFHDKRRHTKEGQGTFSYIFKNLLDIVNREDFYALGCSISIRCNVDKRNYLGVTPLIRKLAENNLQNKISHFYVASVYSWGNDAHLKSFTKEEFADMEVEWIIEQYKNGFQPFLYPGRVRQLCIAVSPNSEMYDAYGNIFNCTEVSYVPVYDNTSYVLGNLKTASDPSSSVPRIHSDWNQQVFENKFQCNRCKMLPVCGGGCPKQWTEGRVACPPPKFNIKDRLLLSYIHAKKGIKELAEIADLESTL